VSLGAQGEGFGSVTKELEGWHASELAVIQYPGREDLFRQS
jgi:hypothetical protein